MESQLTLRRVPRNYLRQRRTSRFSPESPSRPKEVLLIKLCITIMLVLSNKPFYECRWLNFVSRGCKVSEELEHQGG